jgi:cytochrome c biogenesis protein
MTHEVNSRPLPPATATTGTAQAAPGLMDRVDTVLEALWRFLSSMRFGLVLILALAVLGLVGSLVIQAPPGIAADASGQAKQDWLAQIGPMGVPVVTWLHGMPLIGAVVPDLRYRDVAGLFDSLQLFQIFNSVLFRVLVAALTISLIACSIHRIPGMVRTATKPRVDVGPAFFEHAPQHEAVVVRHSPAETLAIVETVLHRRRYRTLETDDGTIHLYADRFRWAPFAGLIGHLALVVILAGAIVGSTFGYRDTEFTIAEGSTLPVAAEQGLSLQLIDFTDTYYTTTGAPEDYASQVVLYKDGNEVARHTIRVNDPLRYGDTTFYQAFFGSAAVMNVKDSTGKTLVSQGIPLAWKTTADNRPIGSFTIPGTNYVGWVVGTLGNGDSTIKPGQVQLELYSADGGNQVAQQVLDQGKAASVQDLSVTFERESQFTGLSIARDPGVLLVWLGAALLFVGFVIRFLVPHKRVWAQITPRARAGAVLAIASLGSREAALGTEFESLVNDIRAALQPPARS